jgi:hypothetical protein
MEVELDTKIIRMLHGVKSKIEPAKMEKNKNEPSGAPASGE